MVQHCALLTAFLASSLSAASHSLQSTQCADAQQELVNQDGVQLLQQQQVLSHPQLLQETLAAFGTSLLQEKPQHINQQQDLLSHADQVLDHQLSQGSKQTTDVAQLSEQSTSEMVLMTQTVNKLEAQILDLKSRKEALASDAAHSANEEHRDLANVSSYIKDFAIQAAERQESLKSEEGKVEEQLSEEHGLRMWAETRATSAEAKELAAKRHSATLEVNASSAQEIANDATASAQAVEDQLNEKSNDLGQFLEQLAEEKQTSADAVAKADRHEKEVTEKALQTVANAKAEAVNATALAHKQVALAQSNASDEGAKAKHAKQAAEETVLAAQTEARRKIGQARTEVMAEVKETHDSLDKAEHMMQSWFTNDTNSPETAAQTNP